MQAIRRLEQHLNCHVARELGLGEPDRLECVRGQTVAGAVTHQSDDGISSGHRVGVAGPESDEQRTWCARGLGLRVDGNGRSNDH
jgi:hypothetical protein